MIPPSDDDHECPVDVPSDKQCILSSVVVPSSSAPVEGPCDAPTCSSNPPVTLADAMQSIGYGRFQWKILLVCGSILGADAMEVILLSFILPHIREEFKLTGVQLSILMSGIFAGMAIGAYVFGFVSDTYGRRPAFILSSYMAAIAGLACFFCNSALLFTILRVITGMGLGGAHVAYAIASEFLPREHRALHLNLLQTFWIGAVFLQCGLAWSLDRYHSWRLLTAISSIPVLCAATCTFTLPESVRFLVQRNQHNAALAVLQRAAKQNKMPPFDDRVILCLDGEAAAPVVQTPQRGGEQKEGDTVEGERAQKSSTTIERQATTTNATLHSHTRRSQLFSLFTWDMLPLMLPLLVIWFVASGLYYGVVFLSPSVVPGNIYLANTLGACSELPSYILNIFGIRYLGRLGAMKVALSTCLVSMLVMWGATSNHTLIVTVASMFARTSAASSFAIVTVYTPEALPTRVRSTGHGICSIAARMAGIATNFVAVALVERSLSLSILVYAAAALLGLTCVFLLPFDTTGRELDEE